MWEAEQADAAEKRKLLELQHEIQQERNFEEMKKLGQSSGVLPTDDNTKLQWMYKGGESTLNREEYLTGRSIDKHFEQQDTVERQKEQNLVGVTVPKNHVEHECIPFSIRAFRDAPVVSEQPILCDVRFHPFRKFVFRVKSKSTYSAKSWKIH